MKCLIMKLRNPPNPDHDEEKTDIHTLDELEEVIKDLGGSAQVYITEKGWVVDDFRKLTEEVI